MTTREKITVLVVDDQGLVRDGFSRIVDAQPDMHVVGLAEDGARAVELAERLRPDVVLMDVRMPGVDGIEATGRILKHRPETRVLGLTSYDSDESAIRMLRAGAVGFVLKDGTAEQLADAVRAVHRGTAALAGGTAKRLLARIGETAPPPPTELDGLTGRERTVFDLAVAGLNNRQIAERLFVSEVTVKSHLGNVLAKLQVRDRVQLLLWAHRHGMLPRDPAWPAPR
ncbi:MAG: response regulator transcription factor [Pseudoclavibacter sp.]|nr:response regulator transcription factor [Pseudoclavibacter sp.]